MGNTPNIRFKGFTDDWEQRKLVDVVDVRSGRDYKHLEEGDIPVYGTGGYMLSVNEALSDDEDAIGIGRKGTIDNPYILRAPFWTVDTLFYAVPRDKYDLNFVFDIFTILTLANTVFIFSFPPVVLTYIVYQPGSYAFIVKLLLFTFVNSFPNFPKYEVSFLPFEYFISEILPPTVTFIFLAYPL